MSETTLDVAITIGEWLCEEAIWSDDRATWLGDYREIVTGDAEVVHRSLDGDVYGGTAGVALFLTRLWSTAPSDNLTRAVRGALAHATEWCRTTRPSASLYDGAGGVASVMAEAALTFADDELAASARDLALEALERPPTHNDLISGKAGAIPALLHVARSLDLRQASDVAANLGNALVAAARRSPVHGASWELASGEGEPALCGLAHGASGIAYALSLLSLEIDDPAYADLAAEAATYERAWYRRDEGNWPDLREFSRSKLTKGEAPPFPVFWCHGAIGIGLARLWQYEATGETIYAAEAEAAIQTALKQMAALSDAGPVIDGSVCHGASGIAELLLEGGRVFDQPELRTLGQECVMLVADAAADGGWPSGVIGGGENPSLMLGTAGIGLVMLRAAEPAVAPIGLLYSPSVKTSRLIVQLKREIGPDQARDAVASLSGLVKGGQVERVSRRGRVLLRVPHGTDMQAALRALNERPDVEYAEADVIDRAQHEG